MYFRMLPDEATGLITYLLADLEAAEAVLIDPREADIGVLQAMLAEHHLRVVRVLCTDGHSRCLAQARAVLEALAARGAVPQAAPPADGELIAFGAEHVRVVATPGHTDQGLSYLWRDRLFCGGLLAPMGCPDAPGVASAAAWWDSVSRKVFTLPPETLLWSGHAVEHHAVSHVWTQRRRHPWFAGLRRDEALARMANPGPGVPGRPLLL